MDKHDFIDLVKKKEYIKRYEISAITILVIVFGWSISYVMYQLGVLVPVVRYPIMVVTSYLFYLFVLSFFTRIWLRRVDNIIDRENKVRTKKVDTSNSRSVGIDLPFDDADFIVIGVFLLIVLSIVAGFWVVTAAVEELIASELLALFLVRGLNRFSKTFNLSSMIKTSIFPAGVFLLLFSSVAILMTLLTPDTRTIREFVNGILQ